MRDACHDLEDVCEAENGTLDARNVLRNRIEGCYGELRALLAEGGTVAECAAVCWDDTGDVKQYPSSELFAMYQRWGAQRPDPDGALPKLEDIKEFGRVMRTLFEWVRVTSGTVYCLRITDEGQKYAGSVVQADAAQMET